jgi:hypothetical protein
MFPMAGGRVNLGVGILSETRQRLDVNVPTLFVDFVEHLRRRHPRCASLELCSTPIGGIVRTYGGAGANHFDGGVLIGDAGSFVDPMTGEGITRPPSCSAGGAGLKAALAARRFDARQLSAYESAFRAYFDPAMTFLDLCAAVLRNRQLARPWLKALARGCELAQADPAVRPDRRELLRRPRHPALRDPLAHLGSHRRGSDARVAAVARRACEHAQLRATSIGDLIEWQAAWARSLMADPLWHTRWAMDVQRKSLRAASSLLRAGKTSRRRPREEVATPLPWPRGFASPSASQSSRAAC